ncbi:InlB B-repeat-containing protein [Paludibaculum fermentans]|uniref:InlB B-repeat-containing protein n=1 Tax=Paludibaculum fermentans TaxID=1473598 RepID=UPI003EB7C283
MTGGQRFVRRPDRVWAGLLGLLLCTAATAFGQSTPMQCIANAAYSLPLRASEISARIGEIVVTCSGGTPTPAGQAVPTVDFQVYFNANYTGRIAGALTESLLLIDAPGPLAQVPCTGDPSTCGWTGGSPGVNVFQGKVLAPNAIAFYGVPVDPPGDFKLRAFQFANMRINASELPVSATLIPTIATASVTATGLTVKQGAELIIGYAQTAIRAAVRNAAGDTTVNSPTGVEFPNCTTVTKQRFANLRFSEQFGTALQAPNWTYDPVTGAAGTPNRQATVGEIYSGESGFYNPNFPATNNLNKAGLADSGTRVQATFSGLPAGATIYVSTVAFTYTDGVPAPSSGNAEEARLITSATGAFAPVAASETLDGIPVAALPITQGSAIAVWEIVKGNRGAMADLDFPVWISLPGNSVGLGTASVTMRLGPVSSETGVSDTAWLPRFVDASTTLPLMTTLNMCPATQYLLTTSPAFLPVSVDGLTYTSPKAFPWQPGSTHTISVAATVPVGTGVRRSFLGWSDGGALTHTITVPPNPATFTAVFKLQYLLDLTVTPAAGGTGTLTPPSTDRYYDPETSVQITASLNPLYSFTGFSGDVNTSYYDQSLRMSGPKRVTATFVKAGEVSSTVGVSPASGAGPAVDFSATYEGSQGADSLRWVQLLLAAAPDGGGQPFCFVHYDVQGRMFWMYSDVEGFFRGPVPASYSTEGLQSSSCAMDRLNYTYVYSNGPRLTVPVKLLFKTAGPRNVYLRALDMAGVDTGWVQRGTWTQEVLPAPFMSLNGRAGGAATPSFELGMSDPFSLDWRSAPLGWVQFLMAADSTGGGQPFCFVHYDRAGDGLWMYSSDVGFFLGPVKPRTYSTLLDSSACSVDTAQSRPSDYSWMGFQLDLQLSLKQPMQGLKKLYMRSMDGLQLDSGWQFVGTHQVP